MPTTIPGKQINKKRPMTIESKLSWVLFTCISLKIPIPNNIINIIPKQTPIKITYFDTSLQGCTMVKKRKIIPPKSIVSPGRLSLIPADTEAMIRTTEVMKNEIVDLRCSRSNREMICFFILKGHRYS